MPKRLLSIVVAALIGLESIAVHAETEKPNVIFILADDLGYAELGCYGQKWIKTPHIDSLAERGMRFTQFYSGNAVCAPSRCNLLTGKHPGHAFVRDNQNPPGMEALRKEQGWEFPGQWPIPDEEVTIAEMLKEQGYATAAIGKWGLGHFGTSGDPNKQGFDLFYGFNCQVHAHNHYPKFLWRNGQKEILPGNDRTLNGETYSQDKFTEVAMEFIGEHKDQPFFLYLPFAIPHLSIQAPQKSLAEYKDTIPEEEYEHRGYLKHPYPRAGYAAMITHLDRDIGRIVELVEQLGLAEKTLIVFTSDNGPTFNRLGGSDSDFFQSAGTFRGLKGSLYEGGIRVPLVACWTGKIGASTSSDHVAALWDVMPTLAELADARQPEKSDGTSFAPTLFGKPSNQAKAEFLYWEFPGYGGQQAVRRGDWKAVRQGLLRTKHPDAIQTELYNLADDPGEKQNVAAEQPQIVAELEAIMHAQHVPSKAFPIPVLDSTAP